MTALGPGNLRFQRDSSFSQALSPRGKRTLSDAKGDVAGPLSAVLGESDSIDRYCLVGCLLRIEDQEQSLAATEENMATGLVCNDDQAEHLAVELLGSNQIVGIKRSLKYAVRRW